MAKGTQIGVFFDGTGNNMDKDLAAECETNVAKLFQLYDTTETDDFTENAKFYIRGVGSKRGEYILGGMTGDGGEQRISTMLDNVRHHLNRPEVRDRSPKVFDVCGFSRGAAQARHFVNVLKHEGIIDQRSGEAFGDIQIRFLALFDSVASFGLPGNAIDPGFDFSVDPDYVQHTLHLVAEHESRSTFDLLSIKTAADASLPANMQETVYPGAHSDIGGGYAYSPAQPRVTRRVPGKNRTHTIPGQPEKLNHLSRISLRVMHAAMQAAGVPLLPLEQHPHYAQRIAISPELQKFFEQHRSGMPFSDAHASPYIHDSRYATDTFVDDWRDTPKPRTVY
ncbi:MAG: DUF2235 domain-containing protein, partial [Gammaproteobacteria bacterium]